MLLDDFLPREVVHRHEEMNRLAGALEPVVAGDRPQDALLVGPSGAGKTCIARYSLDRLQEQALGVDTHYVDCWQHSNRFRLLYKILEGVGTTYDVHRSTPHDELLRRLEELSDPYVIVLDEVDQVEDKSLLRELYAIPEITMVLVANRERDVTGTLDERLRSRLRSGETIRFGRYSDEELVSILEDRVRWGLDPDAVSRDQLDRIAAAAAGNARDAISVLRLAARDAQRDGADRISDERIEAAIPAARREIRQKNAEKLSPHQRTVYDLLVEHGPLAPGDLYDRYRAAVDDPRTRRTIRSYLTKLERYNLVESEGEGPSRRYRSL